MASVNFGKIVYPLRGQPINCSIVSTIFFSFSLWDGSCSWAHNIIKYSLRQREARLSTVKTGFIFLYLFTYFHDVFTSSAKVWGDLSVTTWLEVKQINRELIKALVLKFHWQNNTSCMVVRHPDSTACNTRLILLNILLKKQKSHAMYLMTHSPELIPLC